MLELIYNTLELIYNTLNKELFNDDPLPQISLKVVTDKYYAACLHTSDEKPIDICVSIDHVTDAEHLVAALLHEMIHLYCFLHHIPHYSNGEHLPGFIHEAERRGLLYDDFLNTNFLMFDLESMFN